MTRDPGLPLTAYHFLFSKVYEVSQAAPCSSLEDYHWVPNVARRLLEGFLAFRFPGRTSLSSQLEAVEFDPSKKGRIYAFLNAFSHNRHAMETEEDASILRETRSVLIDLLDLIRSADPGHLEQMIQLVSPDES